MEQKINLSKFISLNFPFEIFLLLLASPGFFFSAGLRLHFLLFLIFAAGVVVTSHRLFIRTDRFTVRLFILISAHTLFMAPVIFVFVASAGGVSQSVVEGVAGNIAYRYSMYLLYTLYALAFAQIFIIPWSLLCAYLAKKATGVKTGRIIFISLITIMLAYFAFGLLVMRSMKPDAKQMYRQYFSTPIAEVRSLRSGGVGWLDSPVCMKFQSKEDVVLKDQGLYTPAGISEAFRFFTMEYPRDKDILYDVKNLTCISYVKEEEGYKLTHWLLHNKRTGHYYFLIEYSHMGVKK